MVELAIFAVIATCVDFFWTQFADPTQLPKLGVAALVVVAGWLAALWRRGSFSTTKEVRVALLLLLLCATISMARCKDLYYALKGPFLDPGHSYLVLLVSIAAFYLSLQNRRNYRVPYWILWASMPMCVYAILQRLGYDPFMHFKLYDGYRAFSSQGGPVMLGAMAAVAMPIACLRILRSNTIKSAQWIAALLILATFWAAKSRGGLVAGAAGTLVGLWFEGGLGPAPLIAVALIIPFSMYAKPMSDGPRIEVWKSAAQIFAQHPLTGIGLMNFTFGFRSWMPPKLFDMIRSGQYFTAFEAHNDILEVLATTGLLGLAAYAFLAKRVWKSIRTASVSMPYWRVELVGALAAAWAAAWFNPIPVSVILLGAVMLGSLVERELTPKRNVAMPALATALACICAWFLYADRLEERGMEGVVRGDLYAAAVDFNRAAQLNPFDMQYTFFQIKSLHSLAPYAPRPAVVTAIKAGLEVCQQGVRFHPYDADAWQLLGIEYSTLTLVSGEDHFKEAMVALHKSADLSPAFPPTLRAIGTVAQFRQAAALRRI